MLPLSPTQLLYPAAWGNVIFTVTNEVRPSHQESRAKVPIISWTFRTLFSFFFRFFRKRWHGYVTLHFFVSCFFFVLEIGTVDGEPWRCYLTSDKKVKKQLFSSSAPTFFFPLILFPYRLWAKTPRVFQKIAYVYILTTAPLNWPTWTGSQIEKNIKRRFPQLVTKVIRHLLRKVQIR